MADDETRHDFSRTSFSIEARVSLDPHPGSIGGDVGGTVDVAIPYEPSGRFYVWLEAISYSSGGGKNIIVVEWKEGGSVSADAGPLGTRFQFRFAVPASLPESGPDCKWLLKVHAQDPDASWTFEIPVRSNAMPRRSLSLELVPDTGKEGAQPLSPELVYRLPDPEALLLVQPVPRDKQLPAAAFGCGLLAAAWYFSSIWVGLFGAFFLAAWTWWMGDSERVRIGREGITYRHFLFGRQYWLRTIRSAEVARVDITVSAPAPALIEPSDLSSADYTVVLVERSGRSAFLVSRIMDSRQAHALKRIFESRLGGEPARGTNGSQSLEDLISLGPLRMQ